MLTLIGVSGKSTVLKLISGYYEHSSGEIRCLGHALSDWSLHSLRENIALVSQDTFLFPGTIKDNISCAKAGSSEQQIAAAVAAVNASRFIEELPDGTNTPVGELGGRLSGGQRQRISLARAFHKDAPLLLLDEPTSALDTDAEAQVQEALLRIMPGRTALIVAHRLSTIKQADRIVVLDKGQIVEEGRHQDLLERGGLYANLFLGQTEPAVPAAEGVDA